MPNPKDLAVPENTIRPVMLGPNALFDIAIVPVAQVNKKALSSIAGFFGGS
jgi:hypothetical protein